MPRRDDARDPWARSPVGELHDPLLPRWFVLLAVVMVPVAVGVAVAAFVFFGPEEVPVEARRPPPGPELTHDVGAYLVGELPPVDYDAPCDHLEGVRVGGTEADRGVLRSALAGICNTAVPQDAEAALEAFAGAGGVVRFAVFEATGVDSAGDLASDPPRILVNAKFTQLDRPRWIAPVVVHDAMMLAGDPGAAETALRARQVEAEVCRLLLGGEDPSRGCNDATELLDLPNPLAALREVGYR